MDECSASKRPKLDEESEQNNLNEEAGSSNMEEIPINDVSNAEESMNISQNSEVSRNTLENAIPVMQNGIDASQNEIHTLQNGIQTSQNGMHTSHNGVHSSHNGVHVSQNGVHASQNGLHASENGVHTSQNGIHPEMNGHDDKWHPKLIFFYKRTKPKKQPNKNSDPHPHISILDVKAYEPKDIEIKVEHFINIIVSKKPVAEENGTSEPLVLHKIELSSYYNTDLMVATFCADGMLKIVVPRAVASRPLERIVPFLISNRTAAEET